MMNFLFLMDPLETVDIVKDTTFVLMACSKRRGHRVFFLPEGGISLRDGKLSFHVSEVLPQMDSANPFLTMGHFILSQEEVDAVFIRTNPPFDEVYLLHTWLLDHLPDSIPVINRPSGIREVNEKLWGARFVSLVPRTLVSRHREEFLEFLEKEGEIIAKPPNGFGGDSIFLLRKGSPNINVIFEVLTDRGKKEAIFQQYVREALQGDKRILLLDGEPIGAVLRVHSEGEHRNNFFAGGRPEKTGLTSRDEEIIRVLRPELKALGLFFVGIDILGEYLIEVNVTSPTCLQEMNRLYRKKLEEEVVDFAETLVKKGKN